MTTEVIPAIEVAQNTFRLDPSHPVSKQVAEAIRWYTPKFSPKDVPRFYDIASITENPKVFASIVTSLVARYKDQGENGPTHILGYDARGFILAAPIALALGIPFVLLRKNNKSPGPLVESAPYTKEYQEQAADSMCIRMGSLRPGDRVVLVDDLIATGGTALSGFQLVEGLGAKVHEFVSVIELPGLNGTQKIREHDGGRYASASIFTMVDDADIGEAQCADPKDWTGPRLIGFMDAIELFSPKSKPMAPPMETIPEN